MYADYACIYKEIRVGDICMNQKRKINFCAQCISQIKRKKKKQKKRMIRIRVYKEKDKHKYKF